MAAALFRCPGRAAKGAQGVVVPATVPSAVGFFYLKMWEIRRRENGWSL